MFMVQSVAASTIKCKRSFKNYVCIGDSIPAGYGLSSKDDDDPYSAENTFTINEEAFVEGSYPQLLFDAMGAKNGFKLAYEAWTAKCVLRIIDPSYEEELTYPANYYDRFESGNTLSTFTDKQLKTMRKQAKKALKNADVVTIELGNNDTFTISLQEAYVRTMYYSYGMGYQAALTAFEGEYHAIESAEDYFAMIGYYQDFFSTVDKNILKYEENYDRIIKRIRQLNPDCEIYVIGMYNLFGSLKPEGVVQTVMEDLNLKLSNELKNYYTKESPYRNEITYVGVLDTEVWETYPYYDYRYWTNFIMSIHPTFKGHRYIANQVIRKMNKNA